MKPILRSAVLLAVVFSLSLVAADGPFNGPVCSGVWKSIKSGHELVYLEGNRLLDWEPSSGHYRIWRYDRERSGKADPLPGGPVVEGTWKSIADGHQLVYMGGDRILDWEPETGSYRIFAYDRSIAGNRDPLTGIEVEGKWGSINAGHTLIYMGGDAVLDWVAETGHYRIWFYDREKKGADDPFPGKPIAEGTWKSIKAGHHLMQFDGDRVLDWEDSGRYRIWAYDMTQRGAEDPFPGKPLAEGEWPHAAPGVSFHYMDGDRILEWNSQTGAYQVWSFEQRLDEINAADNNAAIEDAAAVTAARAKTAENARELEKARREAIAQAQEDLKDELELERAQDELAAIKAKQQQEDAAVTRAREEAQRKYEIERAKREVAKARQEQFLAQQRAIALTRQGVVAFHNPLATSSQYISIVCRWKLWDGSYTRWAQGKIPDGKGWFYTCPGAVSFQVKFSSSAGGEKNYALEANQIPSDAKATFEDGRSYTFFFKERNWLDLFKGKPKK